MVKTLFISGGIVVACLLIISLMAIQYSAEKDTQASRWCQEHNLKVLNRHDRTNLCFDENTRQIYVPDLRVKK